MWWRKSSPTLPLIDLGALLAALSHRTCPGGRNNSGGGGSSGGGYNTNTMMLGLMGNAMNSMMQGYQKGLAIRRQKEQGNRYNEHGLAYERQKKWGLAASSYREALRYWNHPTIQTNLRRANDELSGAAKRRRKVDRRRRAEWAAKRKRLQGMIGNLANNLEQGGTLSSAPDADMGFVPPGGTNFFGTGGAPALADAPNSTKAPDSNGLSFMGANTDANGRYFSKGTRYSGTTDLRDSASGQMAVNANKAELGKTDNDAESLTFFKSGDTVKGAGQTGDVSGRAPGGPLGLRPQHSGPAPSRKAKLLLDSLQNHDPGWNDSRKHLKSLIKANPMDGDARAALKDLDHAEASAKRGDHLKTKQDILADVRREMAIDEAEKAQKAERAKLFDPKPSDSAGLLEAIAKLPEETGSDSERTKMLIAKSFAAKDNGDYLGQKKYLEQALRLSPANADIKWELYYMQRKLSRKADNWLAQGMRASGDGDTLLEMTFYKKAQAQRPNDPNIQKLIANTQTTLNQEAHSLRLQGDAYYKQGNPTQALLYLKQAQKRQPYDVEINAAIKQTKDAMIKQRTESMGK